MIAGIAYYTWALMTPWGLEFTNKQEQRPRPALLQSFVLHPLCRFFPVLFIN